MAYTPTELGIRSADQRPYGQGAQDREAERARVAAEQRTAVAIPRQGSRRARGEDLEYNAGHMQTPPRPEPSSGRIAPVGPPQDQPTPQAPKIGDLAPAPSGIVGPRYASQPVPDIGAFHYLANVAAFAGEQKDEVGAAKDQVLRGDVGPGLLRGGLASLGLLGIPWMYVGSEVAQTGIEANPQMRERFHALLMEQGIDPHDNTSDPTKRAAIADQVIKEYENVAYRAAYDPTLPPDVRIAASVISGLLKAEQFAILGGPQGIRALSNLGRAGIMRSVADVGYDPGKDVFAGAADRPTPRQRPNVNVPQDTEQVAAQGGGVTGAQAANSANLANANRDRLGRALASAIGDESQTNEITQRARAAGFKDEEIAQAAADAERIHAVGVQKGVIDGMAQLDQGAAASSPTIERALGPLLSRAIKTQNKRIQDIVRAGGTKGMSLDQMDEVIAALEHAAQRTGRPVPDSVMQPIRKMRELLYDETRLEEIRRAGAKQDLEAARADVKTARSEASSAQAKARSTSKDAEQRARGIGEKVAAAPDERNLALNDQMLKLTQEQERVRASIDSNRPTVHIAGDSQPHATGYVAPDDAAVWEQARLHTGKQDSPFVRMAFVDFIREHGDQIEPALRHITWDDLITRLAQATDADPATLRRSLPKTAEVSRRLYVADQVLSRMVREWRSVAMDVRDGRAGAETLDTKTAEVAEFMRAVTEGHSEAGRALGSLRVVRRADAAVLVRGVENVKRTERTLIQAQEKLEEISVAFQRAMAGEAVTPEAQADLARIQSRLDTAVERAAAARAEHEAAVKLAAEASDKLHRSLLERAVKLNVSKEKLNALAMLDPEDIQGVIHYFRDIVPLEPGEYLGGYLLNNTYGSIPGLMNNTLNTGLHVLYQNMVIRPLEEGVTRHVANRIVGAPVVVKGETKAAWLAMWSAIPDAAKLYGKVQLMGEAPELQLKYGLEHLLVEEAEKIGAGRRPMVPGPKGLLVEPILRNLSASDGFWRVLDGAGESRARLLRDVYVARRGGDDLAVEELTKFLTQPDPARLAEANEHSLRATFNDAVEVGSNTGKLLQALSIGSVKGFAPLRILIPAARFGISAAKHAVALSGGGLISGSIRMAKARKLLALGDPKAIGVGRRGAQEFTEGALGAMMLIVANHMYDGGLVTGSYPTGAKEQEQWRLENRQEMSVKIAGQWVPLSFLGPLGAPWVLTALLRDQLDQTDDPTLTDRVERGAMGIGRYLTDIPAFSGTYRLMDIIYSGVKFGGSAAWEKFASLQLSKLVPDSATLRSLTPVWDPYERDPEGIIERLAARFPITSTSVRAAIGPTGEEKQRALSGAAALNPTQGVEPRSLGAIEAEMAQDGSVLMPVGNTIGGQKLSREEFARYQKDAGTRSTTELAKLIDSAPYKRELDPAVRQHLRERVIDKARTEARRVISKQFLAEAKGDTAVARAAIMVRSATTAAEYITALRDLQSTGRLTNQVKQELDASRGFNADATRKPTVDELLRGTIRL